MTEADVPELMSAVCGELGGYTITELTDDPIIRDYGVYNAVDPAFENPNYVQILISSLDVSRRRWSNSMAAMNTVLKAVRGRSDHFPQLVKSGRIKTLYFGHYTTQMAENDPEDSRLVIIWQTPTPHALVSSIVFQSPKSTVPVTLALQIGWGMVRALAALHRAGFVHRLVAPHSFSYITPATMDVMREKLLITDLSLCIPFPSRPRLRTPFVGSLRHASVRAHQCHGHGPATDIESVVIVVAEMISGKLPWRSLQKHTDIVKSKLGFPKSAEFKRLPREIRQLYKDMMLTSPCALLDYKTIQDYFKNALARLPAEDLPVWLTLPSDD